MPLVNDGNDLLSWDITVKSVEKIDVLLVDDHLLLVRSKLFKILDKPVGAVSIKTLSKSFTSNNIKSLISILMFTTPEAVVKSSISVIELAERIHAGFILKSLKADVIDFKSTKDNGHFEFVSFFDGKFHLKAWNEGVEVTRESFEPINDEEP